MRFAEDPFRAGYACRSFGRSEVSRTIIAMETTGSDERAKNLPVVELDDVDRAIV